MSDLFLLSGAQMRRIERYFPLSHGIARVDDRLIVSAIVFVIKNGLRWRDAPREYGPHQRSIIGSFAGVVWACSTGFSPNWRARAASRSGS
jgi:transposase